MIVFFNGDFINEADCAISPTDRGFTLGDAVFDTMLSVDGKLQYIGRHIARLLRHAAVLGIPLPMEADLLQKLAAELLAQNKFLSGRHAIRTTLTRGPGTRGLLPPESPTPTLIIRAAPVPDTSLTPVRITIAETVRRNEHSPLARVKSANYGDNLLALMEAKKAGFDDALLLNSKGHLTCATTSNVFIEENRQLYTPPLSDGVLDGITRDLICEHFAVKEETITSERLLKCSGVYLTNSIAGVRQASINDKAQGSLMADMQSAIATG